MTTEKKRDPRPLLSAFEPCIPPELPVTNLDWQRLTVLVGEANRAIARYDGTLLALPNPAVLLSPLTVNEAVLSSRIEGTQATLEEVLEQDAGIEQIESRLGDLEEISNYRAALRLAEQELEVRPLSLSLIKQIHQRLMAGVRGHDKEPGNFRTEQNWIGRQGSKISEARFVPPSPLVLQQALEAWETDMLREDCDPAVQVAISHAQFEILHPFKDGNGRIGRMLVPLLLFRRGALSRPMLYASEYLEAHRDQYYDALLSITKNGEWQDWIEFFLKALAFQSISNMEKAKAMLNLYSGLKEEFRAVTHSQYSVPALDAFFMSPIISATRFSEIASIENRITSYSILRQLHAAGVIKRLRAGSGRRPAVYALPRLVNIAEGRAVL